MYGRRSMLCRITSPVSGTRAKTKAISTVGMVCLERCHICRNTYSSKLYRTGCIIACQGICTSERSIPWPGLDTDIDLIQALVLSAVLRLLHSPYESESWTKLESWTHPYLEAGANLLLPPCPAQVSPNLKATTGFASSAQVPISSSTGWKSATFSPVSAELSFPQILFS
jgi:hypothetical protein